LPLYIIERSKAPKTPRDVSVIILNNLDGKSKRPTPRIRKIDPFSSFFLPVDRTFAPPRFIAAFFSFFSLFNASNVAASSSTAQKSAKNKKISEKIAFCV
jgi:hypothetical protein